jgi:hypothetical protein
MALLGNLPGTVDGLLDTATGPLTSGAADVSGTLDLGAVVETSPSVDLTASGGDIDASVSAPTMIGATADVGHLDAGGLLEGLV